MNGELKLLPCPFCGGRPTLMCNSVVECRNCPTGKYSGYVSADITAWNRRPTPAPGALPELPESLGRVLVTDCEYGSRLEDADDHYYTADQMHAYARAYAEQCRAGVWLPIESAPKNDPVLVFANGQQFVAWFQDDETDPWREEGEAPSDWNKSWLVTDNRNGPYPLRGGRPTHWMPLPAPPALQSAFADDEGVKNER